MTQENLKSLTDLLAEFDRLPRTRYSPDFEDKGEADCISVPVVRGFLQKKFVESINRNSDCNCLPFDPCEKHAKEGNKL